MVLRPHQVVFLRHLVHLQIPNMDANIEDILHTLTLEEKVSLLSGKDFWQTVPVPEKGIPAIKVGWLDTHACS